LYHTRHRAQHRTDLTATDLPATLRDAILVAERLGIRQIWIDSFCIIQDDVHDKAVQLAQMPLIYNQAIVTITTSRAKGEHEGFLQDQSHSTGECPEMIFSAAVHYLRRQNWISSYLP
jgi:hypothetical protein